MTRVLWYSNAPTAATGYGEQTKLIGERMIRDGHAFAVSCNYGIEGAIVGWNGAPLLPKGADAYSNDIIRAHYDTWAKDGPTTLIGLYDSWVIHPQPLKDIPVAWWTPVDHWPAPAQVVKALAEMECLPIAMSRFGQEMLKAAGLPDVRYIPHAIDRAIHKPTATLNDGKPTRQALNVPDDAFLVVTTAANKGAWPPRKAFGQMFQAMGRFMADHPDVYWYVHSDPTTATQGIDLFALAKACNLKPERVRFVDRYAYASGQITPTDMAAIHTAGDVMLLTSMGEGFGIPALESMAASTPVIASDATAQKELVEGVGWLVGGQPFWDHLHGAFMHDPSIAGIVDALEEAYAEKGTQAATDRRARALARAEQYDADTVWAEQWRPLLAELDSRAILHAKPRGPVNTAIKPNKKRRRAA